MQRLGSRMSGRFNRRGGDGREVRRPSPSWLRLLLLRTCSPDLSARSAATNAFDSLSKRFAAENCHGASQRPAAANWSKRHAGRRHESLLISDARRARKTVPAARRRCGGERRRAPEWLNMSRPGISARPPAASNSVTTRLRSVAAETHTNATSQTGADQPACAFPAHMTGPWSPLRDA